MNATTSKPRVKMPVGGKYHGLSIDREFVYAWPQDDRDHPGDERLSTIGRVHERHYLPEKANDAYWRYAGTDNLGRVYQCVECGYLTMSKNARASAYRKIECRECKENGQTSTSWRNIYPDPVNGENYKDVLLMQSEQAGFDPEKPLSEMVPNTKGSLTRIQNKVSDALSLKQMLAIVADSVAEAREAGHIEY